MYLMALTSTEPPLLRNCSSLTIRQAAVAQRNIVILCEWPRMVKNVGPRSAQGNLIPADRHEAHLDTLLGCQEGLWDAKG